MKHPILAATVRARPHSMFEPGSLLAFGMAIAVALAAPPASAYGLLLGKDRRDARKLATWVALSRSGTRTAATFAIDVQCSATEVAAIFPLPRDASNEQVRVVGNSFDALMQWTAPRIEGRGGYLLSQRPLVNVGTQEVQVFASGDVSALLSTLTSGRFALRPADEKAIRLLSKTGTALVYWRAAVMGDRCDGVWHGLQVEYDSARSSLPLLGPFAGDGKPLTVFAISADAAAWPDGKSVALVPEGLPLIDGRHPDAVMAARTSLREWRRSEFAKKPKVPWIEYVDAYQVPPAQAAAERVLENLQAVGACWLRPLVNAHCQEAPLPESPTAWVTRVFFPVGSAGASEQHFTASVTRPVLRPVHAVVGGKPIDGTTLPLPPSVADDPCYCGTANCRSPCAKPGAAAE